MTQTPAHRVAAPLDDQRILQLAHDTLDIEADAVRHLREGLSPTFVQAVRAILQVKGRVVVMGMAKAAMWVEKSQPPLPQQAPPPCLSTPPKPATVI